MRTSLSEISQIENYLSGYIDQQDTMVFEARMILDTELQEKVAVQEKAYNIIKQYSRKKLKAEIEAVHQKLFTSHQHLPFRQSIMRLFAGK